MSISVFQLVLYALGCCFGGVLLGWSIQSVLGRRRIDQAVNEAQAKLDTVTGQKDAISKR